MEVEKWVEVTLGDLIQQGKARLQTGPFGTVLNASEYEANGRPVISVGEIQGGMVTVHPRTPSVGESTAARLSKYVLELGDIVFGRKGGVERTAWITASQHGYFLGSDAISLRLRSGFNSRFFSYVLRSESSKEWLLQHAGGSTMPSMNEKILHRFPFLLPPLKTQDSIVSVLSALDDKIELNEQMNRTLEDLAQALFRSWFVDFDPVVAKREGRRPVGVPEAVLPLFPGHFEESELGPIPKGWKIGTVGNIAANKRDGVSPSDIHCKTPYLGLDNMPRLSISLADWGIADDVSSGKFKFNRMDILFGKLRPNFHKVGVAPLDGICSTDILVLIAKAPEYWSLLLGHATSKDFIDYNDSASGGTRMPRTSWEIMARYPIAVPPKAIGDIHRQLVDPFIQHILGNVFENRSLTSLRDTLLAPLLSGELSLKDAERAVAAAL